jgi:hypothetical protein
VITGFNTDIEHGGVVYHVQTEDKGLDTPLILSLVYVGGAILASKRSSYQDLIEEGFDVKTLTERLQRQHKLICAAIRTGRIEDLKRMGDKDSSQGGAAADAPPPAPPPLGSAEQKAVVTTAQLAEEFMPATAEKAPPPLEIITGFDPILPEEIYAPPPPEPPRIETSQLDASLLPEMLEQAANEHLPEGADELYLGLMDDEGEFRAGQLATIKIYVGRGLYGGAAAVAGAEVTVKVLGTTFRPIILAANTDENGFAVVRAQLPRFNSGRAAIVIRALDGDDECELRAAEIGQEAGE